LTDTHQQIFILPSLRIDETSLWQSFLDGNKQSFETIYTRYYKKLYEYGMRRTEHEELVKDCIQELFIKLWTNRKNIRPTDNIKYYLLAALKNHLINAGNVPGRQERGSLEEADHFKLDFTADTEYMRREHTDQQSLRLLEALQQLTGRQKEVIYLRYFEEMSYEDIAQLMDISVKGTYKLIYRALDALKEILGISRKDLLLLLLWYKMNVH
jgi:RNA polymerase sigma factor (sigma-70 family)